MIIFINNQLIIFMGWLVISLRLAVDIPYMRIRDVLSHYASYLTIHSTLVLLALVPPGDTFGKYLHCSVLEVEAAIPYY
ncbi:hypothetical protein F4811DRAFT_89151 [Daldinia bambusicola]|nr:hypothetical protein F4811DRAFT_89151 [Daldinia bambusicola]